MLQVGKQGLVLVLFLALFSLIFLLLQVTLSEDDPINPAIYTRIDVDVEQHKSSKKPIHIVFSTSCTEYQEWQSRLLIYSARKIAKETAKITRVISGCDANDNNLVSKKEILKFVSNFNDIFVHFTPTFEGSDEFPWINKPLGLNDWLQTNLDLEEETIIILDPDMIVLTPFYETPLTHRQPYIRSMKNKDLICLVSCQNRHLTNENEILKFENWVSKVDDSIKKGKPVAQTYGMSSSWVEKMNFSSFFTTLLEIEGKTKIEYISLEKSQVASHFKTSSFGYPKEYAKHKMFKTSLMNIRHFYSIGPPYIVHLDDLKRLLPLWSTYMIPAHKENPNDILADMYAYSIAAVELDLPHLSLENYMISNVKAPLESWSWIDPFLDTKPKETHETILKQTKKAPSCSKVLNYHLITNSNVEKYNPNRNLPNVFHLSQTYRVNRGESTSESEFYLPNLKFSKRQISTNLFTCESPLLKLPPEDFIQKQTLKVNRRSAFIICLATKTLNNVLLDWKKTSFNCKNGFNSTQLL